MELEFDKEIDALIRREGAARTITIGEFAGLHPDADEIAAFVENAVPVGARREMIGHFAGCDNCRRTLSDAIRLNGETVSTAPDGIAAPVEAAVAVPWYRRLFLFPNLAYVMGGLIVLFGGFIGLSVFNSYQNSAADVSQMRSAESPAAGAPVTEEPAEDYEMLQNANVASMPVNAANSSTVSANAVSNSAITNTAPTTSAANTSANTAAAKDQNFAIDGASAQPQPALAQPAKNEPKPADDKLNEVADRDRNAAATSAEKETKREEQSLMARSAPAAPAGGPAKKTGPSRDERRDTRASESDVSKRKADGAPATGRSVDPNRKQVSGKTFEFRQGAWFDTTYRGQGTTTVRRHTSDYRKLDVGLRGIAESFFGTVVTVWNGKAYRIQ